MIRYAGWDVAYLGYKSGDPVEIIAVANSKQFLAGCKGYRGPDKENYPNIYAYQANTPKMGPRWLKKYLKAAPEECK